MTSPSARNRSTRVVLVETMRHDVARFGITSAKYPGRVAFSRSGADAVHRIGVESVPNTALDQRHVSRDTGTTTHSTGATG